MMGFIFVLFQENISSISSAIDADHQL